MAGWRKGTEGSRREAGEAAECAGVSREGAAGLGYPESVLQLCPRRKEWVQEPWTCLAPFFLHSSSRRLQKTDSLL